ncbi:hypothetical protein Cgig2_029697 [Carnegiea gigantea]|uniref:Uncharacterized protein n=1 Tax=Carnegiea gigantea TaxID=171969 RepID=A0A9Q1QJM7_9CARY|nr:hypothetical protein Cgig2_029697 [Carnegiea gigantea]
MENYTCNCGLEADIFEGDGQYRRRYARCPKRDEVACDFFHLIDANFPERAKEVIDDLVREQTVQRDWLLDDRNAELLTRDEDMRMEAERRAEVDTLKKLLGLAVAVIAIMLAIGMRIDIEYGLKAHVTHTSVKALLLTYSHQLMSTPYEKDAELMILCDCGQPADIIPAQGGEIPKAHKAVQALSVGRSPYDQGGEDICYDPSSIKSSVAGLCVDYNCHSPPTFASHTGSIWPPMMRILVVCDK